MTAWSVLVALAWLLVLPQAQRGRFVTGIVVDESGRAVVGIRVSADGSDGNAPAISESDGSFLLSLVNDIQLGKQVRIRTSDPQKRFGPSVHTIVVSDPPRPLRIELRREPPPTKKPSTGELSLVIERMELTRRTGVAVQRTAFAVKDVAATSRLAADWIRSTLATLFPTTEESLPISATLQRSPSKLELLITPADRLRDDRLWMFARDIKVGHPRIVKAPEAVGEAIDLAVKSGDSMVLHFDRPGYELGIAELDLSGPKQIVLKRQQAPTWTIVVDIVGHDLLGQRLRADLSGPDFAVHTAAQLGNIVKPYEESLRPLMSLGQRLNLLRQARVDVFVSGVYDASLR